MIRRLIDRSRSLIIASLPLIGHRGRLNGCRIAVNRRRDVRIVTGRLLLILLVLGCASGGPREFRKMRGLRLRHFRCVDDIAVIADRSRWRVARSDLLGLGVGQGASVRG